uniref:Fe2OG dioxygenase domain-containing protein n=1 Tax=Araucaria cunninghamii TaxID=56994 RepID=A0A0D6R2C9_ARACU
MFSSMTIPDLSTGKLLSFSVPIVQELASENPHALPEKYVASMDERPIVTENSHASESGGIPIVDMSILQGQHAQRQNELEKLALAGEDWGFFQVINHGISESLMDRMRTVVKGFFLLPLEEKVKYAMQDKQGYGQAFVATEDQRLDWADILFLYTKPLERRLLSQWPTAPSDFRETMEEYVTETQKLAEWLLRLLAEGAGIHPDCFHRSFGEFVGGVRMNYYPPCPRPDLVLGLSPHSDATGITILLQDDQCQWEALHIRKDGEWISVPFVAGALVINIGDMLEVISNGRYKSIEHRAVTNDKKERVSIAAFYNPRGEGEFGPVEELVDDEHPCLYRRVKIKDYVLHYLATRLEGKKAIQFAKVS